MNNIPSQATGTSDNLHADNVTSDKIVGLPKLKAKFTGKRLKANQKLLKAQIKLMVGRAQRVQYEYRSLREDEKVFTLSRKFNHIVHQELVPRRCVECLEPATVLETMKNDPYYTAFLCDDHAKDKVTPAQVFFGAQTTEWVNG